MTTAALNVARGNRYLDKLIDELPGYAGALAVAEQAQQALDALKPAAEIPAKLDPFRRAGVTDEWIDAKINHSAEAQRIEQRRNILIELKRQALGGAEAIFHSNTNTMLSRLHKELTARLNQASKVADQLDGARSAKEAIANNVGPQWKKLTDLADDYAVLREAQNTIMLCSAFEYLRGAQPTGGGEDHASDLYLSNLDDIWPQWRTPGQGGERVIHIDGSGHRYEPWPTEQTELLLWLVTSDARPWIPTTAQLDELGKHRRQRGNPEPQRINASSSLLNKALTTPDRIVAPIKSVTRVTQEDANV
jgi:hypothetical protein